MIHHLRLKTHSVNDFGNGTHIYFDGNPVKFLQGHNLFGTDNLIPLLATALKKITSIPELFVLIQLILMFVLGKRGFQVKPR